MQERCINTAEKDRSLKIAGVGIDIVDLDVFRRGLDENRGLAADLFLPAEVEYCESRARPWESYAARFAAKEAVFKALGRGLAHGFTFLQVEVTREETGAVGIELTGKALEWSQEIEVTGIRLSMSHTGSSAIAAVVIERSET